jgi:putative restriction endonuclease
MSRFREFLLGKEWDAPFFKRLAHNDTGRAAGHQGGIVIPKELRRFFPTLDAAQTSAVSPTIDRSLRVEMYLSTQYISDAMVRYQFQTWGGTRPPESRMTDNLGPLRDQAEKDALLIFQRRADALDHFRLVLVKTAAREFTAVNVWTRGQRWGPLFVDDLPVTEVELVQAATELLAMANRPFETIRTDISRVETRQSRIARSSVFPERVKIEYEHKCCVSGIIIATPSRLYEVEAAHVVPVSEGGTDDIRNGLTLTQTLHWAFDRGLFGVLPNRMIYLPRRVKLVTENSYLKQFEGRSIAEAGTANLRVHPDALSWHFENRVQQWE